MFSWWKFSLYTWRNVASLAIHDAPSEDSDQTARMRRLLWIFARRTCPEAYCLTSWLTQVVKLLNDPTGKNNKCPIVFWKKLFFFLYFLFSRRVLLYHSPFFLEIRVSIIHWNKRSITFLFNFSFALNRNMPDFPTAHANFKGLDPVQTSELINQHIHKQQIF